MTIQNDYNDYKNIKDIQNLLLLIDNHDDIYKMLGITKDIYKYMKVKEYLYTSYMKNKRDTRELSEQYIKKIYVLANIYNGDVL